MKKTEFYDKWLKSFANGVSEEAIQKYVVSTGNFLWHVFSWKLLNEKSYLSGEHAKDAYNNIDKKDAVCLMWFEDDETKSLVPAMYTAEALEEWNEVYVAAPDFSWTYMKTHECTCGPYFMKIEIA